MFRNHLMYFQKGVGTDYSTEQIPIKFTSWQRVGI